MLLKFRPARVEDFDECLDRLRDRCVYTRQDLADLHVLWHDVLTGGAGNFAIIEDLDAAAGQKILYFIFKVFVTDEFAAQLAGGKGPYMGFQVLDELRAGRAPLLTHSELRHANSADGANMVILSYGTAPQYQLPETRTWLANRSADWIPFANGGYRLKLLLMELNDHFEWNYAEAFGGSLYTDYRHLPAGVFRDCVPEPRLYGMTYEDAMGDKGAGDTGTLASLIFARRLPRFGFTSPQQNLLLHALAGSTDEELAVDLRLALVSVKKRWGNIYDRVAEVAPDVLPTPVPDEIGNTRAAQKRRRLLSYVRIHMEELRPYDPPH